MKILVKALGVLVVLLVVVAGGVYAWATVTSGRVLSQTFESHRVDFPVPFPLTDAEIAELQITPAQASELARERAIGRGQHLVGARYACSECHGVDFAGGVMVDAAPIGRILGPNITSGQGSKVADYSRADWDRIVRHGILPDGRPAAMPAEDFQLMSDQELSDIIVYIESHGPVDNDVPAPSLGPVGKILVATGQMPLSADLIGTHDAPHRELPPETAATAEFGEHLAGVCTGCHREDLNGGPIAAGDPSWVPARNITPHEEGLAGWTYEDFVLAMRAGTRPDGTALLEPMTLVAPYALNMTNVEMEALWVYLQSVPPLPTGS